LEILAFLVISKSVQKPSWDTISFRIIDNIGNSISLLFGELTSSEPRVDSQDLANQKPKSSANTSDMVKGKWNGSLSINVGVQNTMDVLEVIFSVFNDE